MRSIFTLLLLVSIPLSIYSQQPDPLLAKDALAQQQWVDSIYNQLSLKEKVGQLFMVRAFSGAKYQNSDKIKKLIQEHNVGGIIYSLGNSLAQAKLNNEFQALSKVPLINGMDAEWGLSMRLDDTFSFPYNVTLGAVKDESLIEKVGKQMGEHCKRLGVHINFAPDIDVNINPKNPVIGSRSFGEDKNRVSNLGVAFSKGMQAAGVLACGKHFPGHGDTDTDSHKALPTIPFTKERIDSIELYPFKKLIEANVASMMIAHLNIPAFESRVNVPSSVSKNIVTDLLQKQLGFNGLVFTDALEMRGVANSGNPGEVDLNAFLAGNDMLLISEDVKLASEKIIKAYNDRIFSEERLAHSVKKILKAKYLVGLNNYCDVSLENLREDLHTIENDLLEEEIYENAITLLKNESEILPIKDLERSKVAYVKFGDANSDAFVEVLNNYMKVDVIKAPKLDQLSTKLKPYTHVIIALHKSTKTPWESYQFTDKEKVWLYEIARNKKVILDVFTKPYALNDLLTTVNIEAVIASYQNNRVSQEKSAQLIFGAIPFKGGLPVTSGSDFPVGTSLTTKPISRLKYGLPESVGLSSYGLKKVDSLAQLVVKGAMAPGLQLLIAKKGTVVYHKSLGHHTYDKKQKVKKSHLYDVASMTKIMATLPMVMKLVDSGAISIDTRLRKLSKELRKSNKDTLTIKQILSHYGRLKPWIPFYLKTLDSSSGKLLAQYYQRRRSKRFSVKVADDLYLRTDYKDSIVKMVLDSDLRDRLEYRYSDLPYYLMKDYIEKTYGKGLDKLVQDNFYKSIGAHFTTYNPLQKFNRKLIIPSENDTYFRNQTVHGYVHDMGAAMLDGVGGHAGIFSNANDVAKIMQMYLQGGSYGGKKYLNEETINGFNTCYYCPEMNRRGVGFDKPQLGEKGSTCGCVSMDSFGHSGFTGTYTWADPEKEIIYVFLSNRTYPTMSNRKLIKTNIRTEIQRAIYDAVIE
ncbi:glycoside hydrolase family 3 N-terminal domain-containing protein [Spongiivirga sp. MCCC 1A20706]|uniref:glycoside hydrolase family 3 N-terminal domain-containing protein n=1 Tax=Spongiivirga sp. MCCC 1A20706 TaxID=3160963 RepID=UPI003977586D